MLPRNNNKGQALLLVIAVLAMLLIVTLAFFALSQVERSSAIRHLNSLRAQYIAEAGVAYAREILELDKQTNLIDSLEDLTFRNFQGADVDLDGDAENESRAFYVSDMQGNPFGRFSVRVSDEASRLHLNSSSSADILGELFSNIGIDSSKLNAVLSRRPFNAKEEIGSILGSKDFAAAKDFLTVYSSDKEIDLDRRRRAYLNSPQPRIILEAFLAAGVNNPYKKAANLKDAFDADLSQTILDEFSQSFAPTDLIEAGSWRRRDNFYEALAGDEEPGTFRWSNLAVEDGEYLCFLYGAQEGDVISQEPSLSSGERWPETVKVEGGSLTLTIKPAKDSASRFAYIELASINSRNGLNRKIIAGTEAVVINELMVKPAGERLTDTPGYIESGQTRSWVFSSIKPGRYYVAVEAMQQGGFIGDVSINGRLGERLRDQDYFSETINVGQQGNVTLEIENNSLERGSFKGIKIIQEPDGEFIEIVNLSPGEINLDNCSVEVYSSAGEPVAGWPARIPEGTRIAPYQHLVLAIDSNDASPTAPSLRANDIYFSAIYNSYAIGLIFDEAGENINNKFDLLPDSGGRVILKDPSGNRIDAVEYNIQQLNDFVSLERPDPSENKDSDADGLFDGWYLSGGRDSNTAGMANENPGMYTIDMETGEEVKNNISRIRVFNRVFVNLEEVQQLPSGKSWKNFSLFDIAQLVDRFAYEAIELELEDFKKEPEAENIMIWEFPGIPGGDYLLSIWASGVNIAGNEIEIGIKTNPQDEYGDFKTLLFTQGVAFYGRIEIPRPSSVLQLKIKSDSVETLSGLKKIRLEPVFSTAGRININTAKPETLRSLFSSENLAETVLQSRPIGSGYGRKLGIGELFLLDSSFLASYNNLTVKSDVYEIYCRGDFLPIDKILAYQTIRTIVERGD